MEGYLLIMGQSCVPECRGSFRVSSNNAALGSPGSSVALAINHPLTAQSSHVVTVPPPHGQQGRGGFLPSFQNHELRVLDPQEGWAESRETTELPAPGRRLLGKPYRTGIPSLFLPSFPSPWAGAGLCPEGGDPTGSQFPAQEGSSPRGCSPRPAGASPVAGCQRARSSPSKERSNVFPAPQCCFLKGND